LPHYPIFLNLKNREVLVVGAGKVGLRKVRGLLEAGAQVIVVAPVFDPEFEALPVRIVRRRFRDSDLAAVALVFAATDSREVNRRVGALAKRKGILANIADSASECDFLVPARVSKGAVQVAISTGGTSPQLASELRKKLGQIL